MLVLAAAVVLCAESSTARSTTPLQMKQVATWGVPGLWAPAYISAVGFSPDGQRALVATREGHFLSWSLASRRQETFIDYKYGPTLVAAAISSTGKLAFGRGLDGGGSIEVYDPLGGKQLHSLAGPSASMRALAFSGDGSRLAVAADAGPVLLWELSRKARVRKLSGTKERTLAVALSTDGSRVMAGGENGVLRVWDGRSGRLLRTLRAGSRDVLCVALSPDGRFALSGGQDRTARLWDLRNGKQLWSMQEEKYEPNAVLFSRDGTRAVISGESVHLLDVQRRQVLAKMQGSSDTLALSPDGSLLALGGGDELWLLDVRTGQELRKTLGGHTSAIVSLAVSADGKQVVSGSDDASIRLWDAARGTSERLLSGHARSVVDVAFSRDGKELLSASWDGTIHVWDATSSEGRPLVKLPVAVTALAMSPTEPRMVFAGKDGLLRLWDMVEEKELRTYGEQRREGYAPVRFSSDGQRILAAREDRGIEVWDVSSGKLLQTLVPSDYEVTSLTSSGDMVIAGTRDGVIQLWKLSTGETIARFTGHTNPVSAVDLGPNALTVVSAGQDQTLRLWDVQRAVELDRIDFKSDSPWSGDRPTRVVVEPDGRSFLVGTSRGLILRFVLT